MRQLSAGAAHAILGLLLACAIASQTPATANAGVRGRRVHLLHVFTGGIDDGASPNDGVVRDLQGNLYGTTSTGGAHDDGIMYQIAPDGTYRVIYSFGAPRGGARPLGTLLLLADGSLVGSAARADGQAGSVVYKLSRGGHQSVLHRFGKNDPLGYGANAGLTIDAGGNVYGVTTGGGPYNCGAAFRLSADGNADRIYAFRGGEDDGCHPSGSMTFDAAGNLYGVTMDGVYKIAPNGTETVLHTFGGAGDGADPTGPLLLDAAGNLYGTTVRGDYYTADCGTVYKLAPDGTETVLHRFPESNGTDGCLPVGGVIADADGNLYGVTQQGGIEGVGTVFRVSPRGHERVLHSFQALPDGYLPLGLLFGDGGSLIGTTVDCGGKKSGTCQRGTVFKIDLR